MGTKAEQACGARQLFFTETASVYGVQLSFLFVAYPSLIITYLGQAAFLMVNPDSYSTTFYASIPSPVYWPMFVVAVLAAIVASQARSNSNSNSNFNFNLEMTIKISIFGAKRSSCI